jgi:hypothetical protein
MFILVLAAFTLLAWPLVQMFGCDSDGDTV